MPANTKLLLFNMQSAAKVFPYDVLQFSQQSLGISK